MRKEPIRHHYIPQFILRNFACDKNGKLAYFCDKESQRISKHEVRDIFMERNLYRDEINEADKPIQIELDLAKFENEVSRLIKTKFLFERKIELALQEDKLLKLFFAIMSFRSANTKELFSCNLSGQSKNFYKYYQKDEDFEDFWKRNLGFLVKCRSMDEVFHHPRIDEPIKTFMLRDTYGLCGKYFAVVESKEGDAFILGDCYPVVIFGDGYLPMYDIFPISPNRAIILASVGVDAAPRHVLALRPIIFDSPMSDEKENLVIVTKRLMSEEVQYINREIEKNSHRGFLFWHCDKERKSLTH